MFVDRELAWLGKEEHFDSFIKMHLYRKCSSYVFITAVFKYYTTCMHNHTVKSLKNLLLVDFLNILLLVATVLLVLVVLLVYWYTGGTSGTARVGRYCDINKCHDNRY